MMKSLLNYILLSLSAMMLAVACTAPASDRLAAALRLVHERPDSAYAILRDIDYDDLEGDSLKARYVLTRALANLRVGRSLITDTLLDEAARYYISAGDTADWVLASQLLSGYDFTRGDTGAAVRRLEAMVPLIRNPRLLWDTYMHLLELSLNSGDYSAAYGYAGWLLADTDVPEQILKFSTAKGGALYMQGEYRRALAVLDSVIATGAVCRVRPEVAATFYSEYAEILNGAGLPRRAIGVIDSLDRFGGPVDEGERVARRLALAQFYANAGEARRARQILDSINHDGTRSVMEVYASIAMLKAALQYAGSGQFPSEMMHKVTKNMHRNYQFAQFDRQTAMESVIELNDDNYQLKLQRQRLRLLVACIVLVVVVGAVAVYIVLSRRKQRMIEAEERAETLERMLKDSERAADSQSSDSDKLRAALLRQLGIFKTFAGTPTPQSRDALRKISAIGADTSIESLVDWAEFYTMIDNLYDGFHSRLLATHPDTFNDKEQQIIVLLKAGFSTKEIGVLTEQSSATIYTRKSVIRRKLGTPENGDIIACLDGQNGAV